MDVEVTSRSWYRLFGHRNITHRNTKVVNFYDDNIIIVILNPPPLHHAYVVEEGGT